MFLPQDFQATASVETMLQVARSLSLSARYANLEATFKCSAGVWEGYSIVEHALMVVRAGALFPSEPKLSGFSTHEEAEVNFLHDAGKPLGERKQQSKNNLWVLRDLQVHGKLNLSPDLFQIYEFLIGEDISIYQDLFKRAYEKRPERYCPNPNQHPFMSKELRQDPGYELSGPLPAQIVKDYVHQLKVADLDRTAITNFATKVKTAAAKLGVDPSLLLELIVRRFQADTLAYTNYIKGEDNRHGLVSLDYIYAWAQQPGEDFLRPVVTNNGSRLTFAPGLEQIFQEAQAATSS